MNKADRLAAQSRGGRKGGKSRAKATGANSLKNIGKLGGAARKANHTKSELAEIANRAWVTRRRNQRKEV